MPALKPITIVGGGLAGLALGIALRRENVPVALYELGEYPRHRVCGEFISGRGIEVLKTLGLLEAILAAGARHAHTIVFAGKRRKSPPKLLPQPALCLSRFALDALLAREFCRVGGELLTGQRWTRVAHGEGVVRATGRRIRPPHEVARWFGLKGHAEGVDLSADLEMHLLRDGYVGLCRLDDDRVNVCGLFRRPANETPAFPGIQERLMGAPRSALHRTLERAKWDGDAFCAVAGLAIDTRLQAGADECCIGDAIAMIAPLTGNGMSMAFESASDAVGPLVRYAHGRIGWAEVCETVARSAHRKFSGRLFWGAWLQRWALNPAIRPFWLTLARLDLPRGLFFRLTR